MKLLKSRIFQNNIRIKTREVRRLKLHIPTNISFGTEMKFKIGRMIKYTDIRNAVSVCSVTGTLSHLRLSQHTLSVQTMSLSVDRALCFPSGPRLVRIPECDRECMLSSLWFGLGVYASGMDRSIHLAPLCVTVTVRVHAVVCYHSFVYE